MTDDFAIARGLIGASQVGDGPTPEQLSVVQGLLDGYFGVGADASSLDPLPAADLAATVDTTDTRPVVDLLVVLEYCRHGDEAAQADRTEEYARVLGVDEPFLLVARDALGQQQDDVMADWGRFYEAPLAEPQAPVANAALATRLRGLATSAAGTVKQLFEFYDRWQIPFPGDEGGGAASLVSHDLQPCPRGVRAGPAERSRSRPCSPAPPASSTTSGDRCTT